MDGARAPLSAADRQKFHRYHSRVAGFVQNVLCAEEVDLQHYIPGSQRIEYYLERLENTEIEIADTDYDGESHSYEEALYHRLASEHSPNILIVIGGLGAGKSTAVRYVEKLLAERSAEIKAAFPCGCQPSCLRRPIKIDNLHVRRETPLKKLQTGVLRALRFAIYNRLIDEWLTRNAIALDEVRHMDAEYKVLRRLLISNDICHFADVERPAFYPVNVHTEALALEEPLLRSEVTIEKVAELVRAHKKAADQITDPLLHLANEPEGALDFTSLVVGFYLSRCSYDHPHNMVIIDNMDQLLTDHIDQFVRYMHDLVGRNNGMRVLIPLRPSSIVPQGFVRDVNYMYHYGPNCSEMMLDRIERSVLARSRAELEASRNFLPGEPTTEEVDAFLIAIYIYALVLLGGRDLRGQQKGIPTTVKVDPEHRWLERLYLQPEATQHLSQTLDALVGTSARYATTQLRRYIWSIYSEAWLLRDILRMGLASGATTSARLPYKLLIATILGDWDREGTRTRLANLYRATTATANPGWPSLAKIRILGFLGHNERVRVARVIDELAQYGVPAERVIEALNYLGDKYRLLVWFSHNSELELKAADVFQYAVIAEHGLGYYHNVLVDFEYIWFCALQIPRSTVPLARLSFRNRLDEYRRIITALGMTEWKQVAFRLCSAKTVVARTDDINQGELLTLWILLSSLQRTIETSAVVARAEVTDSYIEDVHKLVQGICNLVLLWAERYKLLYGGSGFLIRYRPVIGTTCISLRELAVTHATEEVEAVLALLQAEPANEAFEWYGCAPPVPEAGELTAGIARLGRDAVPMPPEFAEVLRTRSGTRFGVWDFLRERRGLAELLERRLPSFTEVRNKMHQLHEQAHQIMQGLAMTEAAATSSMQWFVEERRFLRDTLVELEANEFALEAARIYDMDEMDKLKTKANHLMRVFVKVAKRLGAEQTEHLEVYWQ